jgi:hypothetical protein
MDEAQHRDCGCVTGGSDPSPCDRWPACLSEEEMERLERRLDHDPELARSLITQGNVVLRFTGTCQVPECGWETVEPSMPVARSVAVWHVYEDHPAVWRELAGDRPPDIPDVRDPAVRRMMLAQLS